MFSVANPTPNPFYTPSAQGVNNAPPLPPSPLQPNMYNSWPGAARITPTAGGYAAASPYAASGHVDQFASNTDTVALFGRPTASGAPSGVMSMQRVFTGVNKASQIYGPTWMLATRCPTSSYATGRYVDPNVMSMGTISTDRHNNDVSLTTRIN